MNVTEISTTSLQQHPEQEHFALNVELICEAIFSHICATDRKSCRLVCRIWNRLISCPPPAYDDDQWLIRFVDGQSQYIKYIEATNPTHTVPSVESNLMTSDQTPVLNRRKGKIRMLNCFPCFTKSSRLKSHQNPIPELKQSSTVTVLRCEVTTKKLVISNVSFNDQSPHWKDAKSKMEESLGIGIIQNKVLPSRKQHLTTIHVYNCNFGPTVDSFLEFMNQFPQLTTLGFHQNSSIMLGSENYDTRGLSTTFSLKKLAIHDQYAYSPGVVFLLHLFAMDDCALEEFSISVDIDNAEESPRMKSNPEARAWWFKFLKCGFSVGLTKLLRTNQRTLKKISIDIKNSHPAEHFDFIDTKFLFWWHWLHPFNPETSPLEYLSVHSPNLQCNNNYAFPEWISLLPSLKKVRMNSINIPITRYVWYVRDMLVRFACLAERGCDLELGVNLSMETDLRKYSKVIRSQLMRKYLTRLSIEYNSEHYDYNLLRFLFPLPIKIKPWKMSKSKSKSGTEEDYEYISMQKLQINYRPWVHYYQAYDLRLMGKLFPNLTSLKIYNYTGLKRREYKKGGTYKPGHTDEDLQLILRLFPNLQTIHIEADLEAVTDYGITGILPKEMSPGAGLSFSNLKALRKVSLLGLGTNITNDSLKYGFSGLYYLRNIRLYGYTKIDIAGIEEFKQTLYGSRVRLDVKTFKLTPVIATPKLVIIN